MGAAKRSRGLKSVPRIKGQNLRRSHFAHFEHNLLSQMERKRHRRMTTFNGEIMNERIYLPFIKLKPIPQAS